MSKLNINGTELELDLMDADVMERFEKLMQNVIDKVRDNSQYEGKTTSEGMKFQCEVIDDFFNKMFGEGTAEKLFGSTHHLGLRMDAFGAVSKVGEGMKGEVNRITQKYGIGRIQNREQRRFQQHHGRQ